MNWAQKRKLAYMSGLILFLGIIGFFIVRKFFYITPTCFDKKRNGGEVGVDCGGGCLSYCPNELPNPKIRWQRSFEIAPGIVHSVAYIEHNNPSVVAKEVRYLFKLYDAKNSLIIEKEGKTYLGPMGRSAIVETLIPVGNNKITRTEFVFTNAIPWQKSDPIFSQIVIKTDKFLLEEYDGGTRVTVTLENSSRYSFSDFETVAILYDEKGNSITSSKVFVPDLVAKGNQTIYFTWSTKIDKNLVKNIEIIPRINPLLSKSI